MLDSDMAATCLLGPSLGFLVSLVSLASLTLVVSLVSPVSLTAATSLLGKSPQFIQSICWFVISDNMSSVLVTVWIYGEY